MDLAEGLGDRPVEPKLSVNNQSVRMLEMSILTEDSLAILSLLRSGVRQNQVRDDSEMNSEHEKSRAEREASVEEERSVESELSEFERSLCSRSSENLGRD